MKLEQVEQVVRWAGAVQALLFVGVVLVGLRRNARHTRGRTTGSVPQVVRAYTNGSLTLLLPVTALSIGFLAWLWRPIRLTLSAPARFVALTLGELLYVSGLGLFLWGRAELGDMYNVSSTFGAQLYADHRLIISGPFALVRHPIYLGGMMAEIGALLLYRTWAVAVIALNILVLFIRGQREEEALSAEFGEQWREYARRVPAYVPHLCS